MDKIDLAKVKDLAEAGKGCQIMDELYGKPFEQQLQAFKEIDSSTSNPAYSLRHSFENGRYATVMSIEAKAPSDWLYHDIVSERMDIYSGEKTYFCSEENGREAITKTNTEKF
jgi:hypothetical protein